MYECFYTILSIKYNIKHITISLGSSDSFYIVTYFINWVNTSTYLPTYL